MEQNQENATRYGRKKPAKNTGLSINDHGRVPPQAVDVEEVVLGAVLLEGKALTDAIEILQPQTFYKEAHQRIYAAIQRLFGRSEPVDMLTVTQELRQSGELDLVGGVYYITFLTNRVVSGANVEYHARILVQKFIQRRLIEISSTIIRDAYEDTTDVFELLDNAEDSLFKVNEENLKRKWQYMSSLVKDAKEQIEKASQKEGGFSGVPSGFHALDRVTAGWQSSDLIIIAARPGMGKTAFVLSMARNMVIDHKRPIAFFSLEMNATQLVMRLISSETQISSEQLRKGTLTTDEWKRLNTNVSALNDAPLFIDDSAALSIFELRAKARRLYQQHKIQAVIIDYLQLMTSKMEGNSNREQEIANISRSLKAIAKELNIPVICLSQLSREVEKRGGSKRPQLSDLRESGAIEQDADVVMAIYRPEYYFKDDPTQSGEDLKNKAELIILKHRNGPLETINLKFISQFARFFDDEDEMLSRFLLEANNIELATTHSNSVIRPSRMNSEPEGYDNSPI